MFGRASSSTLEKPGGSPRTLAVICAVGVALRLALLCAAGDLELQSDEGNYTYLALVWERFGFYSDSYRFIWPPGFVWLITLSLRWFGADGLFALKLLQVAASASTGWYLMQIARRLFSDRAAHIAGALWCVYLPLIAYTHYLWPEPLFLALFTPALYHTLRVLQAPERAPGIDRHLLAAGVLFSLALYLKESPLYLIGLLALALVGLAQVPAEGLRRASLFLLVIVACVTPWTLHNFEVYGRLVPIGSTLGENSYNGLNARYKNYDIQPFSRQEGIDLPADLSRAWFVDADTEAEWDRAEELRNTPDRLAENTRRGLAFASAHPGWLVRSRIKKLSDLVAPTSFFIRHTALGRYRETPLGGGLIRHLLVAWALCCPLVLIPLGLAGLLGTLRDRAGLTLTTLVLLYFASTSLLVAMSRFRVPVLPLLIVLAAGLLARGLDLEGRRTRVLASLALLGASLAFLFWVDLPETLTLVRLAWEGAL